MSFRVVESVEMRKVIIEPDDDGKRQNGSELYQRKHTLAFLALHRSTVDARFNEEAHDNLPAGDAYADDDIDGDGDKASGKWPQSLVFFKVRPWGYGK